LLPVAVQVEQGDIKDLWVLNGAKNDLNGFKLLMAYLNVSPEHFYITDAQVFFRFPVETAHKSLKENE